MRDPTWADNLIAAILVIWALFIVFGGLALAGLWLGGLAATQPGAPALTWAQQEDGKRRRKGSESDDAALRPTDQPGECVPCDDAGSSMQVFEDDRECITTEDAPQVMMCARSAGSG